MSPPDRLAVAAAGQAATAAAELLEFAQCGPLAGHGNFNDEPVEKLADACKMTLEIEQAGRELDESEGQLLAALVRFLEGWAG